MSKGGGNQTVTNVQKLPPAVEAALNAAYEDFNPFQKTFDAVGAFEPQVYDGPIMADLSSLQNAAIGVGEELAQRPGYLQQAENTFTKFAQGDSGIGFDAQNLNRLVNQQTNVSPLQGLFGQTASLDPLTAQQNQQNAAAGILGDMATGTGTDPYLQQQLSSAISGAVDKATSQYALGGRLGSNSFAGALGAGITNAAAPILSQNLQNDQANRLAAAQALGNVSSSDLSRDATLGQNIVSADQTNLQNQANIANNLVGFNQADLNRQLSAADSLAQNELRSTIANADAQMQGASALQGLLGSDLQIMNALQGVGALQQAPAQAAIDAQMQQINAQNVADQNQINALLSAAGMGQGMFGTTTTQTGGGPSALSSGLGGALAGAGLASTLGPMGIGLTPALGAGIGGGLGLLGLLGGSDRRLKEDVKRIGTHANGLAMYSWRWMPEATDVGFDIYPTEGFMAQEAQEVYPQHVYTHPSGYLMLDYASLNNEVAGAA